MWWLVRPVVCKLADFGESRSNAVKNCERVTTKHSFNIARGTPVSQAPETFKSSVCGINISDLTSMDIWSFSMILFELLNPNTYAYYDEMRELAAGYPQDFFLQETHGKRMLPRFSDTYRELQQSIWLPLKKVYDKCALYSARKRPSAAVVVRLIANEHVNVINLSHSQKHIAGAVKRKRQRHVVWTANENDCDFLAVIIGDKLLKCAAKKIPSDDEIVKITTDALMDFPQQVDKLRDSKRMYDISEAYGIVRSVGACDAYDIEFAVYSASSKPASTARTNCERLC
jgi:hypothetical protein